MEYHCWEPFKVIQFVSHCTAVTMQASHSEKAVKDIKVQGKLTFRDIPWHETAKAHKMWVCACLRLKFDYRNAAWLIAAKNINIGIDQVVRMW